MSGRPWTEREDAIVREFDSAADRAAIRRGGGKAGSVE